MEKANNRLRSDAAWRIYPLIALLVIGAMIYGYKQHSLARISEIISHASNDLNIINAATHNVIKWRNADIGFLFGSIEDIDTRDPNHLSHLGKLWPRFLDSREVYYQARLINHQGMEILRVEKSHDGYGRVAEDQLQNKAQRYYYREALDTPQGQTYMSRIDLNIEHNLIDIPLLPTTRFAKRITMPGSGNAGLVILNYRTEDLFQRIKKISPNTWLVDHSGYWLIGDESHPAWGSDLQKFHNNLGKRYPETWRYIESQQTGHLEDQYGLWIFKSILECDADGNLIAHPQITACSKYIREASYPLVGIVHLNKTQLASALLPLKQGYAAACFLLLLSYTGLIKFVKARR